MSDTTAGEGTETAPTEPTGEQPEQPTPDTSEIDWKAKSREWEKRAKANADAARKLAEIEESQKTETQRLADAKAAAETEAATARAEALRWRIAAKHGISNEDAETFLTGSDEESLVAQATRLAALSTTEEKAPPGPRPDLSQGTHTPTSGDPASDFATFIQGQLG